MVGEYILLGVLVVLLIGMFVASYIKRKKYNTNLNQLREDLKKGDKVMTDSGIVGEVVDSYEEEGYKYFILRSGKGEHTGYYTVHGNAIYYVFGKDNANNATQTNKETTKKSNKKENKEQPKDVEVKETENKEEKTE